jgi:hypothetical protein
MDRLKTTELKTEREKQWKKQRGKCPLCNTLMTKDEATYDHCHESGHVRKVLHRSCNSAEGRILSWAGRRSRGDDPIDFLKRLLRYWGTDFSANKIHPRHGKTVRRKRRKRR